MDDYSNTKTDGIKEQNPLIQDRTVVALFSNDADARNAGQALTEAGFDNVDVTQSDEAASDQKATHEHGFWAGIKAFFGNHDDARLYGEGVRRGQTLLTLHTQQGRAATAVDIIDRFNPTDVEGAEQAWRSEGWTGAEAAPSPYSPVLADDVAEPELTATSLPVVESDSLFGDRDANAGNTRVRAYARSVTLDRGRPLEDFAGERTEDAILEDTSEDGGFDDDVIEGRTLNKAWTDRTDGVADKGDLTEDQIVPPAPITRP